MAAKETKKIDITKLSSKEIRKLLVDKNEHGVIFGKEEVEEHTKKVRIRTNLPTIDYMSGGGITFNSWTTFCGNPSACKTTTSQQIIPAIQKFYAARGDERFHVYVDAEHAFDSDYAKQLGIDISKIIVLRKYKVLEDVFQWLASKIEMGLIHSITMDSLDGLVPRKTDDNSWNNTMGSLAGALSAHYPNLCQIMAANDVTGVSIRQARVKMNTMSPGEIITYSGGKAYTHHQDNVFIMKRMSNRNLSYTPIQVKAEKTRSARMGLVIDMPLGQCGIDRVRDLVTLATNHNIIEVGGGGWTTFEGFKCQGVDNLIDKVREEPDMQKLLYDKVYNDVIDVSDIVGVHNTIGDVEIKTDLQSEE